MLIPVKSLPIQSALLSLLLLTACTSSISAPTPIPTSKILPVDGAEPIEATVPQPTEIEPAPQQEPLQASPIPLPTAAEIDLPLFQPGSGVTLSSISMLTINEGWGTSGWHLLRTEDGGLHWFDVTPPEPDLMESGTALQAKGFFLNTSHAWVVFVDPNTPPSKLTVWTTSDGGMSWVASTPVFPSGAGEFFEVHLRALDPSTGWLLTDTIAMGTGRNDLYRLFTTTNRGQTWAEYSLIPYVITDMELQSSTTGWMSEEKSGPYDSVTPFLRVTHNAGQNWEIIDLPPPSQDTALFDRYTYCSTYDVLPVREEMVSTIVECYQDSFTSTDFVSYLYQSPDGGATWETSPLPLSTRAGSDLIWVGNQTAYQLSNQMYRSIDRGGSWELFKTVNWDGQFSFVDPQDGWAVAQSGDEIALVHTADGGATWEILLPTIQANPSREN